MAFASCATAMAARLTSEFRRYLNIYELTCKCPTNCTNLPPKTGYWWAVCKPWNCMNHGLQTTNCTHFMTISVCNLVQAYPY